MKRDYDKIQEIKKAVNPNNCKNTLKNINESTDKFIELYQNIQNSTPVESIFRNAASPELRNFGKNVFCKSPPPFLYRFFEVKYIVSTLVEDRLMYSRPRYFEDKKEVSLEKQKEAISDYFDEEYVRTFIEEMNKQPHISEEDKTIVIEKLERMKNFFEDLRESTNICCFTSDLFSKNKEKITEEKWENDKLKMGAICIVTENFPNLHKMYYEKRPKSRVDLERFPELILKDASNRRISGSFYDIISDAYVSFHIKDNNYSWEKEWRSTIIGRIEDDCSGSVKYYEKEDYEHRFYLPNITNHIAHIFVGEFAPDSDIKSLNEICKQLDYRMCIIKEGDYVIPWGNDVNQCINCSLKQHLKCNLYCQHQ